MPVLDFKCRKCGYKFDELVKNTQNMSKVVCPKCGEGIARTSIRGQMLSVGRQGRLLGPLRRLLGLRALSFALQSAGYYAAAG